MPGKQDVIANARKQAVTTHAKSLHFDQFNLAILELRAADPTDEAVTDDHVKTQADVVKSKKAVLGRLAKSNGTTQAKALAAAEDQFKAELAGLRDGWENELAIIEDMIAHPDEYGGVMLDGRPMVPDELEQMRRTFVATISFHDKMIAADGDSSAE